MEDDELWELDAEFDESLRREQEGQASAEVRAGRLAERFLGHLARTPPGEILGVVTSDGAMLRGRVMSVGADFLVLGESAERTGSGRGQLLRIHEIPVGGISRLVREP